MASKFYYEVTVAGTQATRLVLQTFSTSAVSPVLPIFVSSTRASARARNAVGGPFGQVNYVAHGISAERARLSARLRARISVLRSSPILSEEVDGAIAALEQVLAELGAG